LTIKSEVAKLPESRVTLPGPKAGESGVEDAVKETCPVNPPWLATVIVVVSEDPNCTIIGEVTPLLEDTVKSPTVTWTLAILDVVPFTPVTVTVYVVGGVDAVVATVRRADADPFGVSVTLVGVMERMSPFEDAEADSMTVPLNMFRLLTMIEEFWFEPLIIERDPGLA
jgi:hypothetical protein